MNIVYRDTVGTVLESNDRYYTPIVGDTVRVRSGRVFKVSSREYQVKTGNLVVAVEHV